MSEYDRLKKQKNDILAKEAIKITSCAVGKIAAERDALKGIIEFHLKDIDRLTAELAKVKGELEDKIPPCSIQGHIDATINSLKPMIDEIKADRDSWRALAEEMKGALERIAKGENLQGYGDDDRSEMVIAKAALAHFAEGEGKKP